MAEQRQFPEGRADPLGDIPRLTPIIVEGYTASRDRVLREVRSGDATGTGVSSGDTIPIFRSSRTHSGSRMPTEEDQWDDLWVPTHSSPQLQPGKSSPLKAIPYIATVSVFCFAAFYLLVYTPFLRVAWIESLEEHGQNALLAAQKCAMLDMEDSIFRNGSLHPKLLRFGCTMVEPGRSGDHAPPSTHMRPGGMTNRHLPDPDAHPLSELELWRIP